MINFFKQMKSKGLACRMCKKLYRSGLGLLLHIENCGTAVEHVKCEYCQKMYTKLSFNIHVRSCGERLQNHSKQADTTAAEITPKMLSNTGRQKRVSTLKAEKAIIAHLGDIGIEDDKTDKPFDPKMYIRYYAALEDNYTDKWQNDLAHLGNAFCPKENCGYNSKNIADLQSHVENCRYIWKSGYYCKFCKRRVFKTEDSAISHVKKYHHPGTEKNDSSDCEITILESSTDDNENEENEEIWDYSDDNDDSSKNQKMKKNKYVLPSYRKKVFPARSERKHLRVCNKWNNFIDLNYSLEPLFERFDCEYIALDSQMYAMRLPQQRTSMKFALVQPLKHNLSENYQIKTDVEWLQLKRFDFQTNESGIVCFLGAPVKLLAWVPLPKEIAEQYLLAVYRRDVFEYTRYNNPEPYTAMLLLFKVDIQEKTNRATIHLQYALQVDEAPIHAVSFLPSGGYSVAKNRLGLVAAGGFNGIIRIYALPLHLDESLFNCEVQNIRIINAQPAFILTFDIFPDADLTNHTMYQTQCLQICWSEVAGHKHIVASFTNGCIAIWDITDNSETNLNRFVIKSVIYYIPLNYFFTRENNIKCMALHYDTGGIRWLAVICMSRFLIIYDMRNMMQPMVIRNEDLKTIVDSLDWSPLWETLLLGINDSIANTRCSATLVSTINILFTFNKLDPAFTSVNEFRYTPMLNICACGMDTGDVSFYKIRELHFPQKGGIRYSERKAICTVDVVRLDGEPITNTILNDAHYKDKYGIIFSYPFRLNTAKENAYVKSKRRDPLHTTPFRHINAIRCNMNVLGKHLIAIGYENGFIRIINLRDK